MLLRALASFVTAKIFRDCVQSAYWPACKYTQINLLSVDKGGTVLREQVFALLRVYCAIIYLCSFACAILFGNQRCACELRACACIWMVYIRTRLCRTHNFKSLFVPNSPKVPREILLELKNFAYCNELWSPWHFKCCEQLAALVEKCAQQITRCKTRAQLCW